MGGRYPMARLSRLRQRADFLRVAAGRRKSVTPGLILQACRQPPSGGVSLDMPVSDAPRIGFTASRKVGIAVMRNRARRRLRAAVARVMPLHAAPGHDYVVIARAATV